LNNHLYDVQEETRVEIGMQAAVLINFRERILLQNETNPKILLLKISAFLSLLPF
jgi:hypothetical protein